MLKSNDQFKSIEEVPLQYQRVFSEYPCFNMVQSQVLEDVLRSDKSIVVSAPTGSGKTVIFELAIIRLLMQYEIADILSRDFKIIYICPIKALCQERLKNWHQKFSEYGINSVTITGDSDNFEFRNLINHNLIISTPEKWDSLTRKWKDNEKLVKVVKLFMIDEVHLLGEENRGSTLEVIVCRMKTVENSVTFTDNSNYNSKIRFIALSATIPNADDVCKWIGKESDAKFFRFSEEMRPVQLKKIVLGYSYNHKNSSPFKFDLSLNYKLETLMIQYSHGKPTLIFCSTRKSVEMTAKHLVQTLNIQLSPMQKLKLNEVANSISDNKSRNSIKHGIGYHHAGLDPQTRHAIEDAFRGGHVPVLVTTSTLALGVNLPAHLVIIKSTKCYEAGGFRDYGEAALQQMIGRAGRPQFDDNATALILTTNEDKAKFEQMIGCNQPIESNLHRHLTEHLNAEVVLRTITDLDVAMQWLASTFLYVRACRNPKHYGLQPGLNQNQIDKKLLEMCQIDLNKLVTAGMLTMDENITITPTNTGQLMAKYYIAFETMKLFTKVSGNEIIIQILALISKCAEFSRLRLRVNDKKTLNLLNKNSTKKTIRFPLNGKIKTNDMKVNCVIQAVLGNLDINDSSILCESFNIMRNAERIVKCLIEYLSMRRTSCYSALLSSIILSKCFHAKLWENSPFITKQLSGIGSVLSTLLANAGKNNFDKILESNPRDLEMIIKRKPPTGNVLLEEVQHIPKYCMTMERKCQIHDDLQQFQLIIRLLNPDEIQRKSTVNLNSIMSLLVGTNLNDIVIYEKYQHSYMLEHISVTKCVNINKMDNLEDIEAHFISEDWVGLDCYEKAYFRTKKDNEPEVTKSTKNKKDSSYMQMFLDMYYKIKKPIKEKQNAPIRNENGEIPKNIIPAKKNFSSPQRIATSEIKNLDQSEKICEQVNNNDIEDKSDETHILKEIPAPQEQELEHVLDENSASLSSVGAADEKINTEERNNEVKTENEELPKVINSINWAVENSSSLFKIQRKYPLHGDKNRDNGGEPARKRKAEGEMEKKQNARNKNIREFLRPSKKKLIQRDEDNFPDSTVSYAITEMLETPRQNKSNSTYDRTFRLDTDKDAQQKSIKWRSPLVFSPEVKFSPKMELGFRESHSTIDQVHRIIDIIEESLEERKVCSAVFLDVAQASDKVRSNDTFESTSSRNPANLTLNIQNTPKSTASTKASFGNTPKVRGTMFPLSDRHYVLSPKNNSRDHDETDKIDTFSDICSNSILEITPLKRRTPRKYKTCEAPTALNYYSQFIPIPGPSSEHNDTVEKSEKHSTTSDDNKENVPNSSQPQQQSNLTLSQLSSEQQIQPQSPRDQSRELYQPFRDPRDVIISQNRSLTQEQFNRADSSQFYDPRMMQRYDDVAQNQHDRDRYFDCSHNVVCSITNEFGYDRLAREGLMYARPNYKVQQPVLPNETVTSGSYFEGMIPHPQPVYPTYCPLNYPRLDPYNNLNTLPSNLNQSQYLPMEHKSIQYVPRREPRNMHYDNLRPIYAYSQSPNDTYEDLHKIQAMQRSATSNLLNKSVSFEENYQEANGSRFQNIPPLQNYINQMNNYERAITKSQNPSLIDKSNISNQESSRSFMTGNSSFQSNWYPYRPHCGSYTGSYPVPCPEFQDRAMMVDPLPASVYGQRYSSVPRNNDFQSLPSSNDKEYVMNKFLYSLNQQ